ncbi:hypothetical protein ACFV2S_11335 [Streptomyces sp. NPDC059695]|uniref:hypothetical protein n=1 Tax=Streptomyces sp. NPDC059695 TaxID=3346910 RepID=UPI0036C5BA6A
MRGGPDGGEAAGGVRTGVARAALTGPDTRPAALPTETDPTAETGRARLRFPLVRWALAPRTTRQARRLAADLGEGTEAGAAWAMARLARHPDEHGYGSAHRDDGPRTAVRGAARARPAPGNR